MRIGVLGDIHGNWPAYQAILAEFEKRQITEMICLGDIVNPLPSSRRVLNDLRKRKTPLIRGNHEDYVLTSARDPKSPKISSHKFAPVHLIASSLTEEELSYLAKCPLQIQREHPEAGSVLFCHASPFSNVQGWKDGVTSELGQQLDRVDDPLLVAGHWHAQATYTWKHKTPINIGSTGLAFQGRGWAEAFVLEVKEGQWSYQHIRIPYDVDQAVNEYLDSGWVREGSPISLVFLYEIALGKKGLADLFPWLAIQDLQPQTREQWQSEVMRFLKETGRWDELCAVAPQFQTAIR